MTDEQRREHMKEIETQLDKLRKERQEHEDYFFEKRHQIAYDEHLPYVGKCFITKGLRENQNKHIKAFKILEIFEDFEEAARCLTLFETENDRGCDNAIKTEIVLLWSPNIPRMMQKELESKVIDMYKEISQEKFKSLYRDYNNRLDEALYK